MWIAFYVFSLVSTEPVRDIREILIRLSIATALTIFYYSMKYLTKSLFAEIDKRGN